MADSFRCEVFGDNRFAIFSPDGQFMHFWYGPDPVAYIDQLNGIWREQGRRSLREQRIEAAAVAVSGGAVNEFDYYQACRDDPCTNPAHYELRA